MYLSDVHNNNDIQIERMNNILQNHNVWHAHYILFCMSIVHHEPSEYCDDKIALSKCLNFVEVKTSEICNNKPYLLVSHTMFEIVRVEQRQCLN